MNALEFFRTDRTTELLTAGDVAHALRISKTGVWRLVRDGHLPRVHVGRRSVRYRREDVEAIIARGVKR
jgi:excisionase family DNA binding protein